MALFDLEQRQQDLLKNIVEIRPKRHRVSSPSDENQPSNVSIARINPTTQNKPEEKEKADTKSENPVKSLSSTSVSAKEIGLKGNCIYFTDYKTKCVYRFDMDDRTITTASTDHRKLPHWKKPFWVVPDFKMQVHKRVLKISAPRVEVDDELQEERSWKFLPGELLELILVSLSGADIARFRLTCKNWMHISHHPRRSKPFLSL